MSKTQGRRSSDDLSMDFHIKGCFDAICLNYRCCCCFLCHFSFCHCLCVILCASDADVVKEKEKRESKSKLPLRHQPIQGSLRGSCITLFLLVSFSLSFITHVTCLSLSLEEWKRSRIVEYEHNVAHLDSPLYLCFFSLSLCPFAPHSQNVPNFPNHSLHLIGTIAITVTVAVWLRGDFLSPSTQCVTLCLADIYSLTTQNWLAWSISLTTHLLPNVTASETRDVRLI